MDLSKFDTNDEFEEQALGEAMTKLPNNPELWTFFVGGALWGSVRTLDQVIAAIKEES